jgi:hypothetical protein
MRIPFLSNIKGMRSPSLALGVALGILAGVGGLSLAQQITSRTLTGQEVVVAAVGGPGGPSIFVPMSQSRNSQGVQTTALTTGTLVLTNQSPATLISTAAAGGTLVVDLPPTPWDGEIFEWVNGTAGAFTTGNTVATTDGSTIVGSNATGALAASASIEFRYVLATNSWYKLR